MKDRREIKFRAWDNVNKIMFPNVFDHPDFLLEDMIEQPKIFFIMQYTGLKDKNGKEVYEGDILLIPDNFPRSEYEPPEPDNHIAEVVFWGGGFGVKIDRDGENYGRGTSHLSEFDGDYEVVGSLYETPELLNILDAKA